MIRRRRKCCGLEWSVVNNPIWVYQTEKPSASGQKWIRFWSAAATACPMMVRFVSESLHVCLWRPSYQSSQLSLDEFLGYHRVRTQCHHRCWRLFRSVIGLKWRQGDSRENGWTWMHTSAWVGIMRLSGESTAWVMLPIHFNHLRWHDVRQFQSRNILCSSFGAYRYHE